MGITREQLCVECDDAIIRLTDGSVIAKRITENLLRPDARMDLAAAGQTVIAWSGTLAGDLFESHPMNWMQPGQHAFTDLIQRLADVAATAEGRILIQPHSRHVLSDTQTAFNFVRGDGVGPAIGLALCPATLLEPSMFDPVEDHLERIFETLATEADVVLLGDARIVGDGDGASVEPVPLGRGALPADLLRDLAHQHVADGTPVVLIDADVESQLAWLGVDS